MVNKPYDMVSQFTSPHPVKLLGDLDFNFPPGTHAIGRLDKESEGLLLLTTNKKVTRLLFQGHALHKRDYLVQVKNMITSDGIHRLKTGVTLKGKGGEDYISKPADVIIVEKPLNLVPLEHVLFEHPLHTWLRLSLTEGKFHQVRKMVAAVRHPCLRLIRLSIENIILGDLAPGCVKEIPENIFFQQLNIKFP